METVLLLLWRWWWCLVGLCLAQLARVEAAAGQGQCEVLDSSIQSIYSLPTNLTVKPTAPGWLLDFALREGEAPPAACVHLREAGSKVQVMLFKGDCGQGAMEKYKYLPGASVPPRAWTTLALDVKNNAVLVTAPNSGSLLLMPNSWYLPRDALHVTVARGVEAAVGCRVNCPLYRHASEGPDKKIIKKSCQDDIIFYFRPGEEFVRLEYEVTCTTTEGTKEFLSITNVVLPHMTKGMWYLVDLQHLDGEIEADLDYKPLKKEKLPKGCTFTEHTIRLVGDSHFSFSCNPYNGEVEGVEDDSWFCPTNAQSNNTQSSFTNPWAVATMALLAILLVCVVGMVWIIRKRRSPPELSTDTSIPLTTSPSANSDGE